MDTSEFEVVDNVAICLDSFYAGFRPPPKETVNDFADKHRRLKAGTTPEPGQWRSSRIPYSREIGYELSQLSHTEEVVFMKGTQVGATEIGINWQLYTAYYGLGSMLSAYPTNEMAKLYSTTRLQSGITACEALNEKVRERNDGDLKNTIMRKDFPGCSIIITGVNSSVGLRMMSTPNINGDEVDIWPDDVDGQGDPFDLLDKRAANFPRKKKYWASSPTIAGKSKISKKYKQSDQRYYYVPCPHCKKPQIIIWENIKYSTDSDGDLIEDSVYLKCTHCNEKIKEYHKTWMLEHGMWIKHKPKSKIAGFHLSAFYSPLGWFSWTDAVNQFLKAIGDPAKLKVFINTVVGEEWDETENKMDSTEIMKRCEPYPAEVPKGAVILTAGGDTHEDRVEISTIGWGSRGECWVIDHTVLWGDTKQDDVWQLVDQHLLRQWKSESGHSMNVAAVCIDSQGHRTDEVYLFCSKRKHRRIFPTKGLHGAGKPIAIGASKNRRAGGHLYLIGTHQAKDWIFENLQNKNPGPGYIHFPLSCDENYFQQLTSERKKTRMAAGLPVSSWFCPAGKRNETLDCFVGALAAVKFLNPNIELLIQHNTYFSPTYKLVEKKIKVISEGITS
jgi:phage terminase large subunit GpA-like protein